MACKIASGIATVLMAPFLASAQVIITEIMYDVEGTDTDREWIEVQNTGSEPINLSEWKFFESNSNHTLIPHQGGEVLAPGGYAVIVDSPAKFLADWPSFSGTVFDSSFALNNTGETLTLRCCGKEQTDRDSVTYNATGGGAGDGLSLHRSGSSITAAQPSPGNGSVTSPPPPPPEPTPPPVPKTEPSPPPVQQVVQKTEVKQPEEKKQESPAVAQNVALIETATAPEPSIVIQEEHPVPSKNKKSKAVVEEVAVEDEITNDVAEVMEEVASGSPQVAAVAAQNTQQSSDFLWWTGAAAISFFGAGGAYIAGRSQRKKEWQIEEME